MDGAAARSTNTAARCSSPGTARPPMVFTDGGRSAPRSTATACARRATSSPTTTGGDGLGVRRVADPRGTASCASGAAAGEMFLIDFEQGRIVDDEELKAQLPPGQALSAVDRACASSSRHAGRGDWPRSASARIAARPPAGLRLHAGGRQVPARPMAAPGEEGDRLDGQRFAAGGAVRQEQAAAQLTSSSCSPR